MHLVSFAVILILLHSVSVARAKNIANEIEDLYSEIGSLSEDENTEKVLEETNEWLEEMDEDERMEFEGRYPDDKAIENDPEITEVANKDYDNAMGRIIAVNLAHWRKREEKRQLQEKREYQGNVQEMIETTNEAEGFFFDQGDMILDCDLYEELHPGKTCKTGQARTKRNALRTRKRLWTSRVIPYKIPSYMRHIVGNLNKVIQMFHRVSCIRFVPYRGQKNYIFFDNDDG